MVAFETILLIVTWSLLSAPALPVLFNDLTGRKAWYKHNEAVTAISLTALTIGLFVALSLGISWVIFLVIG